MKQIKAYVAISKAGDACGISFSKKAALECAKGFKGGRVVELHEPRKKDETPLVHFFNSPEGELMGQDGDHHDLTPEQTAVKWLRFLLDENHTLRVLNKNLKETPAPRFRPLASGEVSRREFNDLQDRVVDLEDKAR